MLKIVVEDDRRQISILKFVAEVGRRQISVLKCVDADGGWSLKALDGHAEVGWSLRKANQAGGAPAASASPQAAVSIEHSVLGDGGGGGGGSAGGWQSVEGATWRGMGW